MNRSRDAVSTIKGHYFRFDHYILQLLQLQKDNESVRIEGIEDVDIITNDYIEAVQCKYYEGTSCTPSVVGEAIRPMLVHFARHKRIILFVSIMAYLDIIVLGKMLFGSLYLWSILNKNFYIYYG